MLKPNLDKEECARQYSSELEGALERCGFSIGVYGIGADGHTAGIKPAKSQEAFLPLLGPESVVAYSSEDYERITTTAAVIKKLDLIVVYACGEEKTTIIHKLKQNVAAFKVPAQLLKTAKNVVIFN